jgi:tight adherence protein B
MITAVLVGTIVVVVASGLRPRPADRLASSRRSQRVPRQWLGLGATRAAFGRVNTDRSIDPAAVARWVDDIARHLRHGASLHESLSTVTPDAPGLMTATNCLRHELSRGASVVAASDTWQTSLDGERTPRIELLRTVASVISVSATLGGPAAAPFDRVAAAMRQHASDDLERNAHSAQARMSARVMTLLPIAVLTLLLATDADVRTTISTPAGAVAVSAGATLNLLGALWMRRLVGSPA